MKKISYFIFGVIAALSINFVYAQLDDQTIAPADQIPIDTTIPADQTPVDTTPVQPVDITTKEVALDQFQFVFPENNKKTGIFKTSYSTEELILIQLTNINEHLANIEKMLYEKKI